MQEQQPLPLRNAAQTETQRSAFNLDYPNAELVLGLVYAVGTDYRPVLSYLEDEIKLSDYVPNSMHISDWFGEHAEKLGLEIRLRKEPELDRIDTHMKAGNRIRSVTQRADIFALAAATKIYSTSEGVDAEHPAAHKRTAHILNSLKRPEEVETLRKVYGPGFFLIGIFAGENDRLEYLTKRKAIEREKSEALIERDQKEAEEYGQRTRDTFQMADVFVTLTGHQYEAGLHRFLGLVFGDPYATPTRDEHSMFLAYAASLKSGDLARQVGAAISCSFGDVIALGCNDVPAPGGGLYSEDHGEADARDHRFGLDSNDSRKQKIIDDIICTFRSNFLPDRNEADFLKEARPLLKSTLLSDITEFGRSVHAEMDALIAAGRTGVSFREATLYTTTFPCHTCARHIIAAGIKRVVYIEPYPKSLAPELHDDAIKLVGEDAARPTSQLDGRIPFEPFVGIGPRRFFDLFSLKLSSGYTIERKADGKKLDWDRLRDSKPRVPMAASSYLEREQLISKSLNSIFGNQIEDENAPREIASGQERRGVLAPSTDDGAGSRKVARLEDRRTLDRSGSDTK